jgi:hypothetical protein
MEGIDRYRNTKQGELLEKGKVHGRYNLIAEIAFADLENEEGGR